MIKRLTSLRKRHYFFQLLKASLMVSMAPIMILSIYVINEWLELRVTIVAAFLIVILAMILVRPYLSDLAALTQYVENLALDKKGKAPNLSFLSNVLELSDAVKHLHASWDARRSQLEGIIIESKIVFDTLPDMIFMLDSERVILRTNNAAHAIFGPHLYRKKFDYVVPQSPFIEAVKAVLHGESSKSTEVYLPEPIERHYLVTIERFPILSKGGIAAIIVMHDVTESKRTERLFADFVANASHEIRTPLTSLIGFIEILQTTAKDDPEAKERFLGIMAEQAERMASLVKQLLSLSNIERNVSTLPTEEINVRDVVEGVVKHMEWLAKEKHITLVNEIPVSAPNVTGDHNELAQVFTNLVSNAIKYSGNNTIVTVYSEVTDQVPEDSARLRGLKSILKVTVRDQGEGIEPKHLPRLTERFYRVDTARSRQVGGTGLGLSIVKHIMNRHQGTLRITSTVGVGSEFSVYFPLPTAEEETESNSSSTEPLRLPPLTLG